MPIQPPSGRRFDESPDVEALIGNPPGWTLRWGLTVLLVLLVLMFALSWLVSYPDVVEARAVLTTENPPIRIVAGESARISDLKVVNGQTVRPGDLLAVLENPARTEDVFQLELFFIKLQENERVDYLAVKLPEALRLGSLESAFASFSQNFRELQYFLKQDINYLKISNLRKQIAGLLKLNESLARQEKLLAEETAFARKNAERDSLLFSRNSLSRMEYEQSQLGFLQKRRELEAFRSSATQNHLRIQQLEAQILDLQQLQSDGKSERMLRFQSELQRLQGEIADWKQTWLLTAPIEGEVALTKARSEQQFVHKGEEVLTVVPGGSSGRILARALLPYTGSGKVGPGMAAHIRLDGYPYQEFGVLNGTVDHISPVPGEQGYEVEISVPDSLVSSYDKPIPFRQEMQGTVRILTQERRLLERILERVVAAFERN